MGAVLFWVVLLGGPICGMAAIVVARERRQSSWFDIGSIFVPPALFVAAASLVGTQDEGLGLALWPVVVALTASFALALKVFVVDRLPRVAPRKTSFIWFAFLSVASAAFATVAPLWFM